MDKKLISVIIPVYNCDKYVEQCLNSILRNTHKNLQVIVVDDGSTDSSNAVIKKYTVSSSGKYDDRVTLIEQENKGLSAARNVGLKYATGDWVSFVDADDYLPPAYYERLLDAVCYSEDSKINMQTTDIIVCPIKKFNDSVDLEVELPVDVKPEKLTNLVDKVKFLERYPYDGVMQMNKLYKRRIFDFVSYPEGLIHEDEYVIYEEMKHSRTVLFTNLTWYGYRVGREGSITNTIKPKNVTDMVKARANVIDTVVKDSANKELSKADANDWIKFELTKMLNDLIYLYPKVEKTDEVKTAIAEARDLYHTFSFTLEKKAKYELFFRFPKLMEMLIRRK